MTLPTLITTLLLALGVAGSQTDVWHDGTPELLETWISDARTSSPDESADLNVASSDILAFQQLITATVQAKPALLASAINHFEQSGYTARVAQIDSRSFVFLGPGDRHLDSALLLRVGNVDQEVAIQAPHSFHDLATGDAALHAFLNHDVRALFINTTHRHHHSDVTHDRQSFFYQASSTLLDTLPESRIIQLHGFAHEGLREAGVGIVVSNGTRTPTATGAALATSLTQVFNTRHALYGSDTTYAPGTNRYGATRNPIGRLLRGEPDRFIHVELSREIRESWSEVNPVLF